MAARPSEDDPATVVITPGRDRAYLATLPTDAIPMPEEANRLCRMLGLERVADLQRLPSGSLIRRFGRVGAEIEQRVFARSGEVFKVEIPRIVEEAVLHLDQPTDDLETLFFLHKSVIDRLLTQVAATRRSAAEVQVILELADGDRTVVEHMLRPARPTLNGRVLLELTTLWLTSTPMPGPVDSIRVRAPRVCPASQRQLSLFRRQEDMSSDALAEAIARLVAAFGQEAVVSPSLVDRYLPEERVRWDPVTPDRPTEPSRRAIPDPPATAAIDAVPVLRMLDPPRPVTLQWLKQDPRRAARESFGVVTGSGPRAGDRFFGWLHRGDGPRKRVVEVDGPYVLEGEWWDGGFSREYLLLATDDGELCWVFRDPSGTYLHAYLD